MATKQVDAAERNVRKAQGAAERTRAIAHLPEQSRKGRPSRPAKPGRATGSRATHSRPETAGSSTRSRRRRGSAAARAWAAGVYRRDPHRAVGAGRRDSAVGRRDLVRALPDDWAVQRPARIEQEGETGQRPGERALRCGTEMHARNTS